MSTTLIEPTTAVSITPGVCRFCGCTDAHACVLANLGGGYIATCWWVDRECTVCSRASCWERAKREGLLKRKAAAA